MLISIPPDKIVDKDNWGEYICQDGVCNPCSTKLINGHQFEDGYKNLTAKVCHKAIIYFEQFDYVFYFNGSLIRRSF